VVPKHWFASTILLRTRRSCATPRADHAIESRGLTGNADATDQPEMVTGIDFNGPPVRFRADDTPE
jgi:hypothetical protein